MKTRGEIYLKHRKKKAAGEDLGGRKQGGKKPGRQNKRGELLWNKNKRNGRRRGVRCRGPEKSGGKIIPRQASPKRKTKTGPGGEVDHLRVKKIPEDGAQKRREDESGQEKKNKGGKTMPGPEPEARGAGKRGANCWTNRSNSRG